MLESLENMDIKRMVLDSPEKRSWFDAREEITESDREQMVAELGLLRSRSDWTNFSALAAYLLELGIEVTLTDDDNEQLLEELDQARNANDLHYSLSALARSLMELGITFEPSLSDREIINQEFEKNRKLKQSRFMAFTASDALALGMPITLTEKDKHLMTEALKHSRTDGWGWERSSLIRTHMDLGLPVEIPEEDKDTMLKVLEGARNGKDWMKFASTASDLKRISEFEPPHLEDENIMPVQRQF